MSHQGSYCRMASGDGWSSKESGPLQESSAKHRIARIAIPLSVIRKSRPKKIKKLSFSMFQLLVPMSLGCLSLQLGTLPCSWQISLGVDQLAEPGPCVQFQWICNNDLLGMSKPASLKPCKWRVLPTKTQ